MAFGTSSPITTVKKVKGMAKSAIPRISAVVPETFKNFCRNGRIVSSTSAPPTAADKIPTSVIPT
jgi:hypothetical protein